jgi:hypothetical protein
LYDSLCFCTFVQYYHPRLENLDFNCL